MKIILGTVICITLGVLWLVYDHPRGVERRVWERLRPRSYSFEYQYTCFCPGSGLWWKISVRDEAFLYYQAVDPSKLSGHFPALERPPLQLTSLSTIFDDIAKRASGSTYYRCSTTRVGTSRFMPTATICSGLTATGLSACATFIRTQVEVGEIERDRAMTIRRGAGDDE